MTRNGKNKDIAKLGSEKSKRMDIHRDEAMMELERGREFANQLRQMMKNIGQDHHTNNNNNIINESTQHLVNNVLNSFSNTLLLLNKHHNHNHNHNHNQMQLQTDFSFISSPSKSEESHDSCKTTTTTLANSGRGCYKRRKTTETWEKVSENLRDDGHQWRKYGQKKILTSKYSRNYYRCTHKVEQRCQATKQVQRIQEEPPMYKTTYYNHHTCKNLENPDIIFDLPTSPDHNDHTSSILLSFNNTFPTPTKQDCPFLSSSHSVIDFKEQSFPSPSMNDSPDPILDQSISTRQANDDDDDDDHKDMMMYGDLLFDSYDLHDDFFQPFLGIL